MFQNKENVEVGAASARLARACAPFPHLGPPRSPAPRCLRFRVQDDFPKLSQQRHRPPPNKAGKVSVGSQAPKHHLQARGTQAAAAARVPPCESRPGCRNCRNVGPLSE